MSSRGRRSGRGARRDLGRLRYNNRPASLNAADIAVDIFQRERQYQGFGATPELRSLELLNDCLKTLDLAVPMLDGRGDVAHQAMQKSYPTANC
jgi:hypothetical protein